MTDAYMELAERNNEIYSHILDNPRRDFKGIKRLSMESENELISYDEKELRWRKPYLKISVEELESMVDERRYN